MTSTINTQGSKMRLTTVIGGAIAAVLLAVYTAVMMPASAHADPNYLNYSADGSTWGGMEQVPALTGQLIPGGEATSTFHAKNNGTEGGRLQVYLGNWSTSANMQAYVRAEINDASGAVVDLVNDVAQPGTELNSIHLAPGQSAKVLLVVGIPSTAGNETQNGTVDPNFTLDFELDAAVPNADTTTVVSGVAAATVNTPVQLTATVNPAATVGTVQFSDGATAIGSPVTVSNGVATLTHTFTTTGAHAVTAAYSGGTGFTASTSAAFTVTVSAVPAVPTTTVVSGVDATTVGNSVQLTATVDPAAATGTVQFSDGATAIGSPVALTNGVATLTHTFTTAGTHNITAAYSGSTGFSASISAGHPVAVTTVPALPTTISIAGGFAVNNGTNIALTATVVPNAATGSVQFKDNGVNLGFPVELVNGSATANRTFNVDGDHSITAVYLGSATYASSESAAHVVTVSSVTPEPGGSGSAGSIGS